MRKKVSLLSVSEAVSVRIFLMTHATVCIWYVTLRLANRMYWLLTCLLAPLIVESFYTIVRRQGRDFTRLTPCFLFYLTAVLPGIWLLEMDRTEMTIQGRGTDTINSLDPNDIKLPGATQNVWLTVIEELMPYVIFISRWILPRGKVTRRELAELLVSFLEIGTDIMEFFALIGQDQVRGNKSLVCGILAVWSFSVLQFTMTFTVIHSPKRNNSKKGVVAELKEEKKWQKTKAEIYAIFLSIVMQDLPFVIVRLYLIIGFNLINYSMVFFACKNLLKIVLLLYKAAVRCIEHYSLDPEEEDDAKDGTVSTELGKVKDTGNGNMRKNSFAGSLRMLDLNGNKSNLIYSPQRHSMGDAELGVNKRTTNSKQRNHTSKDKEEIPAEIKDRLFFQYEHTRPRVHIAAALFRPHGLWNVPGLEDTPRRSSEKTAFRNGRKSPRVSKEYQSSDGERSPSQLYFAQRNTDYINPVFHALGYGVYSNLGQAPKRAARETDNVIPSNAWEQFSHSTPNLARKTRREDAFNATSHRTQALTSEDVYGHAPKQTHSSLHRHWMGTWLSGSTGGWNLDEPMPDYETEL